MPRYEVRARRYVAPSQYEPHPFIFYPYRTKFLGLKAVKRYNKGDSPTQSVFYLYDLKKKEEVF